MPCAMGQNFVGKMSLETCPLVKGVYLPEGINVMLILYPCVLLQVVPD